MRHAVAALLLLLPACSAPAPAQESRDLPLALREVSGLAAASPGSVFAHDDERAIVHEIDLATGRAIRIFSLGGPPARGDFEGIAADRDRVWLIASDGQLLAARIGADGARVPFEVHDTGAGADCEIEGLSLAPEPGNLLILCKRARRGGREGRLIIYQWNIAAAAPVRQPWRDIDLRDALGDERSGFAPSSIEWVPARRQLVLVSARDRRLLVLDETGRILGTRTLSAARHSQPEGLAITASGALAVADEGQGGRPARLTIYPPDYLRQVLSSFEATSSALPASSKKAAR
jgi:hypothetical protein